MTVRLGRITRELLLTAVDLRASDALTDPEAQAFLHKHRKALREMPRPRQVPVLTTEEQAFLQGITDSKAFTVEKSLAMYPPQLRLRTSPQTQQPELGSNMTTGPNRTPLRPWSKAQVAAYKKQRLEEANDANPAK